MLGMSLYLKIDLLFATLLIFDFLLTNRRLDGRELVVKAGAPENSAGMTSAAQLLEQLSEITIICRRRPR
ncbi:hypothetical protein KXD40_002928 [Peronospora effusa]|uniref:Uncharacterized protein n=1 Tax=Peronospora effusa TaxID=542832 RepID=A0A3M6VFN9_9STRA|nr:hypothetical protein DD238_005831 [Peronospora effusa]RQM14737.1 hypothetical protein DD237_002202 [Peronospora effusa]UIZ29224.1 hypothetical protein KXD40_002928 [Peronospora effusa]